MHHRRISCSTALKALHGTPGSSTSTPCDRTPCRPATSPRSPRRSAGCWRPGSRPVRRRSDERHMPPADFSKYPRDMVGYGRNPPDPRWPNGARVAVQFVVNYEEGGERNILHGDATSEAFLSDV